MKPKPATLPIVIALIALVCVVPTARASTLTISAPVMWDDSLAKGMVFYMPFKVTNAVDIYAWQINSTWDPTVLSVVNLTLGGFWGTYPSIAASNLDRPGMFLYGMSFLGIQRPPHLPAGSTVMVTVAFRVLRNNVQTKIHLVTSAENTLLGAIIFSWEEAFQCQPQSCPTTSYATTDGYFGNVHSSVQTLPSHWGSR